MTAVRALYLDIDEEKCLWMEELIKAGAITDGEVRCSDIRTLTADDVRGFRRVHFFAGIAIWDYALNLAGWDDSIGVTWTASCPCPSFSAAGKGLGFSDPRHLWPELFRIARVGRPDVLFGEQVESAIGHGWLDALGMDLEAEGYALGAAVLSAGALGAPHLRDRLYFVADTHGGRSREGRGDDGEVRGVSQAQCRTEHGSALLGRGSGAGLLADPEHDGRNRPQGTETITHSHQPGIGLLDGDCTTGELGHAGGEGQQGSQFGIACDGSGNGPDAHGSVGQSGGPLNLLVNPASEGFPLSDGTGIRAAGQRDAEPERASVLNGFWRDAHWIWCRDGKWRPVPRAAQSELEQMADVAPGDLGLVRLARQAEGEVESENVVVYAPLVARGRSRVLRLRGYGDGIVAATAAAFIRCYREARGIA